MGTRSLTIVRSEDREVAVMYRQMDGYLAGHGKELKEFLSGIKVVNGIPLGKKGRMANGAECLAAQIVAHFKSGVGGFYIFPAGTRDCGEEYRYTVTCETGFEPMVMVESGYGETWELIYSGCASEMPVEDPVEDEV